MSTDPFAPFEGAAPKSLIDTTASDKPAWVLILPVPENAPAPPTAHPRLGKPSRTWCYRDAAGGVLGYVKRFEAVDGKQFRPLTYAKPAAGRAPQWRWESWSPQRPLYGLDRLAQRSDAAVVVTEGEKAADAASILLASFVVVTSPNGSKSAGKADWSPLRDRHVTVWPDADAAGRDYATTVAKAAAAAGALSVSIISPPSGCAPGWDAADAEASGWDALRATELIAASVPADRSQATAGISGTTSNSDTTGSAGARKRVPQRDTLIGITQSCELWHDANRVAYASFPVNAHRENWPIRSRDFRMWLAGRYYEETGSAIGGQALEDGIRILEARAVNAGPQYDPFIRVGEAAGKLFIDMCHDDWRAIEISASGWRIVGKPAVKLMRSTAMRPMSMPESGGLIEQLRGFINTSDDDFMLIVAWLVASMRQCGPYPMLVLNGEQGSGKSMVSRMLRSLVDPSAAPIRAVPKDDRDLVVSAGNSWMLVFDNLSTVPAWLSDALCRLCTGSGFATRMLHTDNAEMIFEAARPIILNGIPSLTDRADLADRSLTIHLKAISEKERRPEDELWKQFEDARPHIISALCDAVAAALRNVANVKLDRSPRMADFVKWVSAAESGLGWDEGAFYEAYTHNRKDVSDSAFEADSVAMAIRDFVMKEHPIEGWEGTASELLQQLNTRASEGVRKARSWPLTAQGLGNRVDRIAPLLRGKGFFIERRRSITRIIIIVPPKPEAATVP
jgi:hypothetical protein